MILEELFDGTHPHATFHDADLQRIHLDYVAKEAQFDFQICVGDPDAQDEESRESRRAGRLTFSALLFCVIEPPDQDSPYQEAQGLWVADDGPIDIENVSTILKLPEPLPEGAFIHYFFINDWNASIYVAAKEARFEWR